MLLRNPGSIKKKCENKRYSKREAGEIDWAEGEKRRERKTERRGEIDRAEGEKRRERKRKREG